MAASTNQIMLNKLIFSFLFGHIMCAYRKYPYPPHGRSLEILSGRGVSTAKIYKGKYEAKLEIPGEREGLNEKTFHGEGMDILWNHTINILLTKVIRSVWEKIDLGCEYRLYCLQSVLTTLVKILPSRSTNLS